MNEEKKQKLQRYLAEAMKASFGCNSATCTMNPKKEGQAGTAVMCRCGYIVETMVKAANQIVEKDI